jgi:hypothetical protein
MPDIPAFGPGENLVEFGKGLMDVGAALGNVANVAGAYQNAAAASEFLAARTSLDNDIASHLDQSSRDPNFQELDEKWLQAVPDYLQKAQAMTSLPKAKSMFDKYAGGALKQAESKIYQQKRIGLRNDAENNFQVAMNNHTQRADFTSVEQDISVALEGGIISSSQAQQYRTKYVSEAKSNFVKNLIGNLPFSEQMDKIPGAATQLGIVDKIDDLRTWATQQYETNKKVNSDKQYAAAKQIVSSVTKSQDANEDIPIPELRASVIAATGTPFESYLKGVLNEAEKKVADTQKLLEKTGMSVQYQTFSTPMSEWKYNTSSPVPPWTPSTATFKDQQGNVIATGFTQALSKNIIDEPEATKLTDMYEQAVNYKKESAHLDDPAKVGEAWAIALDQRHGWTTDVKGKMLENLLYGKQYLNHGITGGTADTILKAAQTTISKALSDSLKTLDNFYTPQLQAALGNEQKLQKISLSKADAERALYELAVLHPNEPQLYDQMVHQLTVKDISKTVNDKVTEGGTVKLGAVGFLGFRYKVSDALQMEIQYQENPTSFDVGPKALHLRTEFENNKDQIVKDSIPYLPSNARDAVPVWNGRILYFQKDGITYLVRSERVGDSKILVAKKNIDGEWVDAK